MRTIVDIFLSRPGILSPDLKKGCNNFENFLRKNERFKPRTVGYKKDTPRLVPGEDTKKVMKDCFGAIILGYPRAGKYVFFEYEHIIKLCSPSFLWKNKVRLPTEWNHIEAAMASILELPLLIIQHKSDYSEIIDRGVFCKKASILNIPSVDLYNEEWYREDSIKHHIHNWKREVILKALPTIIKGKWRHRFGPKNKMSEPEDAEVIEEGDKYIYKKLKSNDSFILNNFEAIGEGNWIIFDKRYQGGELLAREKIQIKNKNLLKGHKELEKRHILTYERLP